MMISGFNRRCCGTAMLALCLGACSSAPPSGDALQSTSIQATPSALDRAAHLRPPRLRTASGPNENPTQYRTFRVAPASCLQHGAEAPAFSAGPLFLLRNQLEARGYRTANDAAMIALLRYRAVPTTDIYSIVERDDRLDASLLRHFMPAPAVTLQPAQLTRCRTDLPWGEPPALPAVASGDDLPYFNLIQISLYRADTGTLVWAGEALGLTTAANPAVSSLLPLRGLIRELPAAPGPQPAAVPLGLDFIVATTDGRRFQPIISHVDRGSTAAQLGLQAGETIVSINGSDTLNHSTAEIQQLLQRGNNTAAMLTIERDGHKQALTLHRELAFPPQTGTSDQ